MRAVQSAVRLARQIRRLEVHIYAAYASYFLVLAVFPAMMLLIGVLQYTPIRPSDLRDLLERLVPITLGSLLDYMIEELFAVNSTAVLSVSAVVALWMASRGIVSLHHGLNRVYSVQETRSSLRIHLRSMVFTLAAVLTLVVILGFGVFNLLRGGSHLRVEESENYSVEYNQELNASYLLTELDKLPVSLYLPHETEKIVVRSLDEQNQQLEERVYSPEDSILLEAGEADHYLIEADYTKSGTESQLLYLFLTQKGGD